MNILIKTGLVKLLFASGIADKGWFRFLFKISVLIFVIFLVVNVVSYNAQPQPYEVLVNEEGITLLTSDDSKMPLFGENEEYYYYIYPATHYKTKKDNSCAGFNPVVRESWCGDEKIFPNCNPGVKDCFKRY
jgi:hypothetical protein